MKAIKRMRVDLLAGLAIIFPLIATAWIIRFLVTATNNAVLAPLSTVLEPYMKGSSLFLAKILIFIGVFVFIWLIGLSTRLLVLKRLIGFGESFLYRVPLINRIYRAVKQISTAFLGEGKSMFKRVVLVQFPRPGMYSIGFLTTDTKEVVDKKTGEATLSIFLPTTPNPTSGYLIMVPKKDVTFLDMTVEDGMKFVISGGTVTP
jgi:uncharacterized membrane protein